MKRFTKITLMASAIAAMAGAACLIVCLFLGFTWADLTALAADFHMPGIFRHITSWNVQTDPGSDPTNPLDYLVSVGDEDDPDDTDNYDNMEIFKQYCSKLDLEIGAGSLSASLTGEEANYDYNIQCGIGEVMLGKKSYSGFGHEQKVENPGANRHIDIECGAGTVAIRFDK